MVKEHHLLYAESTPNYAKDLGASSKEHIHHEPI
jgi:hypothetical protein